MIALYREALGLSASSMSLAKDWTSIRRGKKYTTRALKNLKISIKYYGKINKTLSTYLITHQDFLFKDE